MGDPYIIDVRRQGQEIMVIKHEVNRKRQDVLGELEEADGIKGPVGGLKPNRPSYMALKEIKES